MKHTISKEKLERAIKMYGEIDTKIYNILEIITTCLEEMPEKEERCSSCGFMEYEGSGNGEGQIKLECNSCGEARWVTESEKKEDNSFFWDEKNNRLGIGVESEKKEERCTKCNGACFDGMTICPHCKGSGKEPRKEVANPALEGIVEPMVECGTPYIQELEAKLSRYKEALERIANHHSPHLYPAHNPVQCYEFVEDIARTALAEEKTIGGVTTEEFFKHWSMCTCKECIPDPQEGANSTMCTCFHKADGSYHWNDPECPVHGKGGTV